MKPRLKVAIVLVVAVAFAAMTFIPVIAGPNSRCNSDLLCIPNQKFSVTQAYLGFGSESSYNGKFYYLCGLPNLEDLTHIPAC